MRSCSSVLAPALAALLAAAAPCPARAAGDRFEGDGVSLRFVAEPPGADGRFRAALMVDLQPGWKTYWLDPGEAGIPPALGFERASGASAAFPVPHRFDDGFAKSIVYSEPFAVAIEGKAESEAPPVVRATLGLCREVCVPVTAELAAGFAPAAEVRRAVDAAFAALPRESSAESGIVGAALSADRGSLAFSVSPASAAAKADLFVAGPPGWTFGAPTAVEPAGADAARVVVPVVARPRKDPGEPFAIDAVLAGPSGAWRASRLAVARER